MDSNQPVQRMDREATWRAALTAEQRRELESWLAAHPEERGDWEEEQALTRLLTGLPEAPAPSNLTARILAEVDREATHAAPAAGGTRLGWLRRRGWVPRLAGVAVLVVAGVLGHHQYQTHQRAQTARSVVEVTELAAGVPPVEVLQDFTVIRNLEHTAMPDEQLLALLK